MAPVDGLVLARSAMRHSTDYRSVVLFGRGEAVEDPADKAAALLRLVDKMSPGRGDVVRPPDGKDPAATGVVRLAIAEGAWPAWAGTVPVALRAEAPVPASGRELATPQLPSWLKPA